MRPGTRQGWRVPTAAPSPALTCGPQTLGGTWVSRWERNRSHPVPTLVLSAHAFPRSLPRVLCPSHSRDCSLSQGGQGHPGQMEAAPDHSHHQEPCLLPHSCSASPPGPPTGSGDPLNQRAHFPAPGRGCRASEGSSPSFPRPRGHHTHTLCSLP